MIEVVADNGFECYIDSQLVQAIGKKEGIRVLTMRSQHLRADGNDLRNHC